MRSTYLIAFAFAFLESGFLSGLVGCEDLLTLLRGMDSLNLIGGVAHKKEDFRLTALLPVRWKELTGAESNRIIVALGGEEGVLKIDVVDEELP
jgi:hypothetical protein